MLSKNKLLIIIILVLVSIILLLMLANKFRNDNEKKYQEASRYYMMGQYDEAQKIYASLGRYKDSEKLSIESDNKIKEKEIYTQALDDYNQEKYMDAINKLNSILGFEDVEEQIKIITYKYAVNCFAEKDYETARKLFLTIEDYEDSESYLQKIEIKLAGNTVINAYIKAQEYYNSNQYDEALELFKDLYDYKDSQQMVKKCEECIKRENLSHKIACGVNYSLGLNNKGEVLSGGDGSDGQCDVRDWDDIVSIDGYGVCTIGLDKYGTVKVAGLFNNEQIENVKKWNDIVDVAAGERYVVALKNNGYVVAEGHNGDKQCDVQAWRDVIDVDAGWRFTVGLTSNHELLFSGISSKINNDYKKNIKEWKRVVSISASGGNPDDDNHGKGHVVGLKDDGTLIAIGDNSKGQCEVNGDEWRDIISIATGDWYTVALRKDRKILITGKNEPGMQYIDSDIYNWTNIREIAAGYGQTLGITSSGEFVAIGFNDFNKRDDTKKWLWLDN